MTVPPLKEALTLLEGAATWHEFRRSLHEVGLESALSAAEMQTLLHAWHRRQSASLGDAGLVEELAFWAGGGSFEAHMEGWFAPSPRALVEEAEARGWFVRHLPGGALVNPPQGAPLHLKGVFG